MKKWPKWDSTIKYRPKTIINSDLKTDMTAPWYLNGYSARHVATVLSPVADLCCMLYPFSHVVYCVTEINVEKQIRTQSWKLSQAHKTTSDDVTVSFHVVSRLVLNISTGGLLPVCVQGPVFTWICLRVEAEMLQSCCHKLSADPLIHFCQASSRWNVGC